MIRSHRKHRRPGRPLAPLTGKHTAPIGAERGPVLHDAPLFGVTRLLALLFLAVLSCTYNTVPGGGTANTNDNAAASPLPGDGNDNGGSQAPGVSGCPAELDLFAVDRRWVLLTSVEGAGDALFSLNGTGRAVDYAAIVSNLEGEGVCTTFTPEVDLRFDGLNLALSMSFADDLSGRSCSISVEGALSRCGQSEFDGEPVDRYQFAGGGTAEIAGSTHELGAFELLQLEAPQPEPCDAVPASLEGRTWVLTNVNPSEFGDLDFPNPIITLSGSGDRIEQASFLELDLGGLLGGGEPGGCIGEEPEGDFVYDGRQLVLELTFEDSDAQTIGASPCTMQFSGRITGCETFVPPFGLPGSLEQTVIRVEGLGRYSSDGLSGNFGTLFFAAIDEPAPPPADLCREAFQGIASSDFWNVANADPLDPEIQLEVGDARFEANGFGANIDFFFVTDPDAPEDADRACIGDSVLGNFTFTGEILNFDLRFGDGVQSCSANYRGERVSCETVMDDVVFGTGRPARLMRFSGRGLARHGVDSVPLTDIWLFVTDGGV